MKKIKCDVLPEASLNTVLIVLNTHKFCVVVDQDQNCIGTITDGDIRRFLINSPQENPVAKSICNTNYIYSKDPSKLPFTQEISHIPVFSEQNKYLYTIKKELSDLPHLFSKHTGFVIMAGGLGSRMGIITKNIPKPMLNVAGIPIIERIIRSAKRYGFSDIFVIVNHLSKSITSYLKDGSELDVNINYIHERDKRGTAGSLDSPLLDQYDNLLVTNGDILSDINLRLFRAFHMDRNNSFTMAVKLHSIKNDYGIVDVEGLKIKALKEKPIYKSYINAGIYVVNAEVRKLIVKDEYIDMTDLCLRSIQSNFPTEVFPFTETWHDIGSPNKLHDAEQWFYKENLET